MVFFFNCGAVGVIAWQRLTGRETAHYQLGLQVQAILHDFDRKPEEMN